MKRHHRTEVILMKPVLWYNKGAIRLPQPRYESPWDVPWRRERKRLHDKAAAGY